MNFSVVRSNSLVAVLLVLLFVASVSAEQDTARVRKPPVLMEADSSRVIPLNLPGLKNEADRRDALSQRRLSVAQTLVRQRNWAAAASLLEVIVDEEPANQIATRLLIDCYRQLKQFFKAEHMLRSLLRETPDSFAYRLSLAELLVLDTRPDEALEQYKEIAEQVTDFHDGRLQQLFESALDYGFTDYALALIGKLRTRTGDSTLFGLERGRILQEEGRYSEAVAEFFPLLAQDTTHLAALAEKELLNMLDFVGSADETRRTLLGETQGTTSPRALRLLSTHYLMHGDFDRAFELTLLQDSLENGRGTTSLFFMRQCFERKRYDQVLRMGENVLALEEESPVTREALRYYAEALARMGRYDSAIAVFQAFAESGRSLPDKAYAACEIADIYADHLDDCETALDYYDSAAFVYQRGAGALEARRTRPICMLRLGRPGAAAEAWTQLLSSTRLAEWAEEAEYHLALLRFFDNEYDSATTAFRKLIVDYPKGLYINDAIRLLMVMSDGVQDPERMKLYAQALYYTSRKLPDSAYLNLIDLATDDSAVLTDVAYLKLAGIEFDRGDTASALNWIDDLLDTQPESYFVPYALRMKADVLALDIRTREEAVNLYRGLLQHYPNYPFMTEIRRKLKEMEESRIG